MEGDWLNDELFAVCPDFDDLFSPGELLMGEREVLFVCIHVLHD